MAESNTEFMRKRLMEQVITVPEQVDTEELKHDQWCSHFEHLMRNRLVVGACRYGPLRNKVPNGYDNIGSAIERLQLYQESGNLEHLVDAANLCLVEFVTGQHPNRHFEAVDDGIHTKKVREYG